MQVGPLLLTATELLDFSESARLDAELLLAHVLQVPRSQLMAYPEREIVADELLKIQSLIARRQSGEPVAYLLGYQEFWSLSLEINSATLIPRPETELLVELVLSKLPEKSGIRIADLGTGSGAIALAVASERRDWSVVATDVSDEALVMAQKNAQRLQLKNITFIRGSWCEALPSDLKFDVIVSNPPYIAEVDDCLASLKHEPKQALVSGPTGLEAFEHIISQAHKHLKEDGLLLLEHGFDQATQVSKLLQTHGYQNITQHADLAGIPRVCVGVRY